jgi:hypothetical protein
VSLQTSTSETETMNKRTYRKPVLKRLGLLRRLTRYTF